MPSGIVPAPSRSGETRNGRTPQGPPKCFGVRSVAVAQRHPMVHCEHVTDDSYIRVWQCPVCGRFLLEWL